jgi:hypothetical protein
MCYPMLRRDGRKPFTVSAAKENALSVLADRA